MRSRTSYFAGFFILSLIVFWVPLSTLVHFSFEYEHYSHIILVPLVSAYLMCRDRRTIFAHAESGVRAGTLLLGGGAALYWFSQAHSILLSQNDQLSLTIFPIVLVWLGGFAFCYGTRAFRTAAFPLAFLFLAVPIPDFLLQNAILILQKGSAEATQALFRLVGVPVLRQGFLFVLPGLTIDVAPECSGIRSSLALFTISLLVGHFSLESGWRKVVLSLSVFPIAVIKNGMRIVTLCLLTIYRDPSYLSGSLHRRGGIPFFVLAFAVLTVVVWLLQRSEKKTKLARAA